MSFQIGSTGFCHRQTKAILGRRFATRRAPRQQRSYQQRSVHKVIRMVCERCNAGWMSRLDEAAKDAVQEPILVAILDWTVTNKRRSLRGQ